MPNNVGFVKYIIPTRSGFCVSRLDFLILSTPIKPHMSDEPSNPHAYPASSQSNLPYVIQEANPACVIHESQNVIQGVSHTPVPVSQAVSQPGSVSHNPSIPQLNSVKQECDTACITKPINRHYPIAIRLQIRKDYIHGLGTLPKLAAKHGIPVGTARTWRQTDSWSAARNRWRAKQMQDDFDPQPIQIPPTAPIPSKSPLLSRIEAQLEALDNFLDNANSPEDWQKLTNAKDKLLQNYYVLAGIAKPGARKAGKTSPARVQPIEPVEPGNP